MYGIDPAGNETKEFKQVMSLYSKVALIKKLKLVTELVTA